MDTDSRSTVNQPEKPSPWPKTELEAARLLIKAQTEYIEASNKHVALLNAGIGRRDELVSLTGNGYPRSWKHSSVPWLEEKQSAEQLALIAERVKVAQLNYDILKPYE